MLIKAEEARRRKDIYVSNIIEEINDELAPGIIEAAKHGYTSCVFKIPASHVVARQDIFNAWSSQLKKEYGYSVTSHEISSNGTKTYIISW